MKLLISILLIIIITTYASSQECKSVLLINSDNKNVSIFINDSIEYKNQFEIELRPGSYRVSVLEERHKWDAKSFYGFIKIDSCETRTFNVKFYNEVLIDSDPQDAQVLEGDSLLGYTPLILSGNFSQVTLKKDGFAETEISVDQRLSKINASLEFIGQPEREKFLNQPISKILFGTMIVFGATSAYYKIKADDNFDEYLKTGELKFKDRTKKYDLISGITLGLTQINFGYLIYKIFFDN